MNAYKYKKRLTKWTPGGWIGFLRNLSLDTIGIHCHWSNKKSIEWLTLWLMWWLACCFYWLRRDKIEMQKDKWAFVLARYVQQDTNMKHKYITLTFPSSISIIPATESLASTRGGGSFEMCFQQADTLTTAEQSASRHHRERRAAWRRFWLLQAETCLSTPPTHMHRLVGTEPPQQILLFQASVFPTLRSPSCLDLDAIGRGEWREGGPEDCKQKPVPQPHPLTCTDF